MAIAAQVSDMALEHLVTGILYRRRLNFFFLKDASVHILYERTYTIDEMNI